MGRTGMGRALLPCNAGDDRARVLRKVPASHWTGAHGGMLRVRRAGGLGATYAARLPGVGSAAPGPHRVHRDGPLAPGGGKCHPPGRGVLESVCTILRGSDVREGRNRTHTMGRGPPKRGEEGETGGRRISSPPLLPAEAGAIVTATATTICRNGGGEGGFTLPLLPPSKREAREMPWACRERAKNSPVSSLLKGPGLGRMYLSPTLPLLTGGRARGGGWWAAAPPPGSPDTSRSIHTPGWGRDGSSADAQDPVPPPHRSTR